MSELLGQLSPPLVLIVGWLLIVAEAGLLIGVFLPGTSVLVALGYLSHLGVVPLGATIAVAAFAAITGTQLSFLMGRRRTLGKRRTLGRRRALGKRRTLGRRRALGKRPVLGKRRDALAGFWEHGRRLLVRRGVWAVLAGQWLGSARTLVPRLAGWSGMSYRAFACASLPSAAAWAATLVSLSRFLAPDIIHRITGHLALAGPSAVALLLLVFWLRHRRRAPADDVAGHRRQRVAVSGADRPSRGRAGEGAGR
ncbi:DedA family protein [Nonomuraea sp. NPDC050680]|uniref:DedA family protein n=1 Tax=Nonomuraea sp. NPDC050680 TaxID=3154630 RepID=UPI0033D857EA